MNKTTTVSAWNLRGRRRAQPDGARNGAKTFRSYDQNLMHEHGLDQMHANLHMIQELNQGIKSPSLEEIWHRDALRRQSNEAGDRLRAVLLAVALVGAAGAYLARSQASATWLASAILFGLSFSANLVSWFALKARELARRDAARRDVKPRDFATWDLMASWTWDSLSFALVAAAGILLFLGFT